MVPFKFQALVILAVCVSYTVPSLFPTPAIHVSPGWEVMELIRPMRGNPSPQVLCFKLGLQEPGVCALQWPWEAVHCLEGSWASLLTFYILKLEARLHQLSSTNQEANSENQQLREAERDLAGRLDEVREQLQVTKGHLNVAKGRVSWQMEEEPRQVAAISGLG